MNPCGCPVESRRQDTVEVLAVKWAKHVGFDASSTWRGPPRWRCRLDRRRLARRPDDEPASAIRIAVRGPSSRSARAPRTLLARSTSWNPARASVGTAEISQSSCALPPNQCFESRAHHRRLLSKAAQFSCPSQQAVVDIERGPHMHRCATSMHTRQTQESVQNRAQTARRSIAPTDPVRFTSTRFACSGHSTKEEYVARSAG
jgi:hypothetical protein